MLLMGSKVREKEKQIVFFSNDIKKNDILIKKLSNNGKLDSEAGKKAISRNSIGNKLLSIYKHQFTVVPQLQGFDTPSIQDELKKEGILDLSKKIDMSDDNKTTKIVR